MLQRGTQRKIRGGGDGVPSSAKNRHEKILGKAVGKVRFHVTECLSGNSLQSLPSRRNITFLPNSMPKFYCVHCGQHINAPEVMSGMHSNCPTCGGAVEVPGEQIYQRSAKTTRLLYDGYTAPGAETLPHHRTAKIARKHPGLNRWQYALSFFGIVILFSIISNADIVDPRSRLVFYVMAALSMVPLSASRFRNMGASPWWCLFGLIPLVSLVMYMLCFAQRPGCYTKTK